MKLIAAFIAGALVSTAFHYDRDVQANEPDVVFVHTEVDVYSPDDIGLVRLTVEDIVGLL